MKKLLVLLTALPLAAFAQTATFDSSNNQLTVPALAVGASTFQNVVIKLNAFDVVSVGQTTTPTTTPTAIPCSDSNFTQAIYDQLQALSGKVSTLAALEKIVGCSVTKTTPQGPNAAVDAIYSWRSPKGDKSLGGGISSGIFTFGGGTITPSNFY